jgi:hypothetical protein
MGAVSGEHGERFHQNITRIKKKIERQMEPKYVGYLLLDACMGFTDRKIQKTKGEKMSL